MMLSSAHIALLMWQCVALLQLLSTVHVQAVTTAPTPAPTGKPEPTHSEPVLTAAANTFTGTYLTAVSYHTREVTNITWSISALSANALDYIAVYEDKFASHIWFQTWNPWLVDLDPPEGSVNMTDATAVKWCNTTAVAPFKHNVLSAFHSPAVLAQALSLNETLLYTGSKARVANTAVAATGTSSIALTEPGLFKVCLFLNSAADPCVPVECITVELYQPPYDYLEVESNNLVEPVTVRFNLASTNATPGDWYYSIGDLPLDRNAQNTVRFSQYHTTFDSIASDVFAAVMMSCCCAAASFELLRACSMHLLLSATDIVTIAVSIFNGFSTAAGWLCRAGGYL
jgi:hypothetical protein